MQQQQQRTIQLKPSQGFLCPEDPDDGPAFQHFAAGAIAVPENQISEVEHVAMLHGYLLVTRDPE
jgi:hypothetical protein